MQNESEIGPEFRNFVERLRELHRIGQQLTSLSDRNELVKHAQFYLKHVLSYQNTQIELKDSASLLQVSPAGSRPDDLLEITIPIELGAARIASIHISLEEGQVLTDLDKEILHCLAGFIAVGLSNIERLEQLNVLASTDPLTGIMNRRQLFHMGTNHAGRTRCTGVIVFDIDHFKRINDAFGHAGGDAVLRYVVARAKENIRETDLLARFGGDEFVILLPDTRLETALTIAERIRTNIRDSGVRLKGRFIGSTISAGLACVKGVLDLPHLIGLADRALYAAKQEGRNSIYFHRVRHGAGVLLKYPRTAMPVED